MLSQCILIQSGQYPWLQVTYLIELGEWMHHTQAFSVQDSLDQFQHAVHILLSLRDNSALKKGQETPQYLLVCMCVCFPDGSNASLEVEVVSGAGADAVVEETGEGVSVAATAHVTTSPSLSGPTPRLLSNPVLPSHSSLCDVAQLEALMRVQVMMAQLHGAGMQAHWDLCVGAVAYCSLMWKVRGCHYMYVAQRV